MPYMSLSLETGYTDIDRVSWRRIPRRHPDDIARGFIAHLPRLPLSASDNHEHRCPICLEQFGSTETVCEEGNAKDEPIQLTCGHVMGSACILHWLSFVPEPGCPVVSGY